MTGIYLKCFQMWVKTVQLEMNVGKNFQIPDLKLIPELAAQSQDD